VYPWFYDLLISAYLVIYVPNPFGQGVVIVFDSLDPLISEVDSVDA